jgi:hypothetical protein
LAELFCRDDCSKFSIGYFQVVNQKMEGYLIMAVQAKEILDSLWMGKADEVEEDIDAELQTAIFSQIDAAGNIVFNISHDMSNLWLRAEIIKRFEAAGWMTIIFDHVMSEGNSPDIFLRTEVRMRMH